MYEKKVEISEGVQVEISGNSVSVTGNLGSLKRRFSGIFGVKMEKDGNILKVSSESEERKQKATVGTIVSHIKNMMNGVTEGYTAKVRVIYSHFPVTVKVDDRERKILIQNFIGEKDPRVAKIIGDDTKVEVEGTDVTVTGTDIESVGQTSANMEMATKIRGHDRRIFQDGAYIVEKPKKKRGV